MSEFVEEMQNASDEEQIKMADLNDDGFISSEEYHCIEYIFKSEQRCFFKEGRAYLAMGDTDNAIFNLGAAVERSPETAAYNFDIRQIDKLRFCNKIHAFQCGATTLEQP